MAISAAALTTFFTLSTLLAASASEPSLGRDFHLGHSGWNGLSRLGGLGRDLGCNVEVRRTLDWSSLDGQDVLFVLHPETPLAPNKVLSYLSAGGRLILADDFGESGELFARLGIYRKGGPAPAGTAFYRQNRELPIATPQRATALGRATTELVGNHTASFNSALPATYAFAPGFGLVIEGTVGHGRFVAIADPSIFINNMLEVSGNRDFLARLLVEFCRPQRDRLLLLYGPLGERGAPPAVLLGAPLDGTGTGQVERLNSALTGTNLHIQETLQRRGSGVMDVIGLSGLLFCLGAMALLLRYLPMPVPHKDAAFAQPPRPPETGLFASIVRYAGGAGQAVSFGYVYPAALIREEVLARLQPFLLELAQSQVGAAPPSPAQVQALLSARLSPRAGELAATLLVLFRKLDRKRTSTNHPSEAHISAHTLRRFYDLAVELFAMLDLKEPPKRPLSHR